MWKRKFFAKALAFAMVTGLMATAAPIGAAAPVQVYADGASTAPGAVVDYEDFTLKMTTTSADAKFFKLEVLKDEQGTKVSATHTYPIPAASGGAAEVSRGAGERSITVDLSFLKPTKAQYLRVSTDDDWTATAKVTVNPQPGKVAAKYKASETTVIGRLGLTVNKKAVADLAGFEYRGLYGSKFIDAATSEADKSKDLTAELLDLYAVTGTTLVVRKKAVNETDPTNNAPASAEAKIKIPALAKAPKVSLDYAKGLISLPKGAEISKDGTNWKPVGDSAVKWSAATLFTNAEFEASATVKPEAGFDVLVRTAKTEKKAASNYTIFTVPASPVGEITGVTAADGVYPATDGKAIEIKSGETTLDGKVTIAKEYDLKNGVSYKFKVADASFDFSLDEGKSWKTIKDGKDFVVYCDSKEAQTLLVRRSGVKAKTAADSVMASAEIKISIPAKAATPKVEGAKASNPSNTDVVAELYRAEASDNSKVTKDKWEYLKGSEWVVLTAELAKVTSDDAVTMTVRLAADTENKTEESDPVTITLAAKPAAE